MERIIFHIDVNSAYLSWESAHMLQHGYELDLRTVPSAVGGDESKRHGIVLAKSIPAKKFGVQTGESLFSARKKCPQLLVVPPHYELYVKASDAMIKIIEQYSPAIQRFSIDEVFADMSHAKKDYMRYAKLISKRIERELGFTVNIGISENKLLAKMASDFEKPNKIHTLFKSELEEKFWPLDIGKLYMVGRKTKKKLVSRGINTIKDLANSDPKYIRSWLKKPGLTIWEYANGIENSKVDPFGEVVKSVSNSTTTSFDVDNFEEAKKVLLAISEKVGMRLREIKMAGQVISVGIKNFEFMRKTHQRKLFTPTNNTNKIYEKSVKLFREMWNGEKIRQFSIRVSELFPENCCQLSFFDDFNEKALRLDKAIDDLRAEYGGLAISRATFLHSGISPIIGGVLLEEKYPMMKSEL